MLKLPHSNPVSQYIASLLPLRAHLSCHVTTALPSTIIDTFPGVAVGSVFMRVTVEVRGAEDRRPAVYALSGRPP